MADSPPRLVRAWLDSPSAGVAEFDRDWPAAGAPQLRLGPGAAEVTEQGPAGEDAAGRAFGYFRPEPGRLSFLLPLEMDSGIDLAADTVYVAGDFNGWGQAVGNPDWRLARSRTGEGGHLLRWSGPEEKVYWPTLQRFKFVTGEHLWLPLPDDASNTVRDDQGNCNRLLDPRRSGRHLWRFVLAAPLDLAERWFVSADSAEVPLEPDSFFHQLRSDLPLGAIAREGETTFRIFAPRARRVTLSLSAELGRPDLAHRYELQRLRTPGGNGVWEVVLDQNLHGWFYWYQVDGMREGPGRFEPEARILDPYALAAVDRDGPGIVLEAAWIGRGDRDFATPEWQDLVIAEAHVRDLTARAPIEASAAERRGFVGLRRWVESPEFYLHRLGVNCVELQPVHEFDNATAEEYHWGYMPNSYFAPESSYSLAPAEASGVRELQALVAAFHRRGMAVLIDVVFNHVGLPPHLMRLDRLYYFEQDSAGKMTNWSGCGNDLRARAAMARRLIIDSCTHLIEAYGVDGFRFDLAELLGLEILREIEAALKRVKPDVVLIAEPWSFRGHIAGALRDTGWAYWNDTFRDFVREYVLGRGQADRLEYFLRGSPWYYAKWPAQTVNYTESHDDRTWSDVITENPRGDATEPTDNDRRRTRLMASVLFMSLGIPMIAAGQDFLRSKGGVANTYQRGDLNALDYRRLEREAQTHAYFAAWIAFRRGPRGRLLRHYSRPSEGFFRFFRPERGGALAVAYNADGTAGPGRILFTINPGPEEARLPLEGGGFEGPWLRLADQDRFFPGEEEESRVEEFEDSLLLPPMSCGLWIESD